MQTVFVVSYMVFAPIFGYLGDRFPRKYVMAFGITVWSGTTFACSLMGRSVNMILNNSFFDEIDTFKAMEIWNLVYLESGLLILV